jgi:hypothetical protein
MAFRFSGRFKVNQAIWWFFSTAKLALSFISSPFFGCQAA